MLREGGEGAEQEVEGVLEEDGEGGDGRAGGQVCGEGFNARPGKVDVEEEKEGTQAGNGGLVQRRVSEDGSR